MLRYFVYYDDGYYDDGCVGLQYFDTREKALLFIEGRMNVNQQRHLNNYLLIEGKVLVLRPVEVVTKLAVVDLGENN